MVERPFRNKKFNFKRISFFLLTIGSLILIFNLLVFKYNGFIERLPRYLHYIVLNSEDDLRKSKLPKNFFDEINHKNVYKIYPHKLFCNIKKNNKCIFHDENSIYFFDKNHPSLKGAEMINELIMKEIKKIELKSN